MTGNIQEFDYSVDVMRALLWQYNEATRLQKLLELKQLWYTANQTEFWQDWRVNVFDLRTANEFGLSVWAIILDVPLSFEAPASDVNKIGWGFGTQRKNFNNGNFKRHVGGGVTLTLEQKRLVLRLRYFQLTNSGNAPDINTFMRSLFLPDYGAIYVRDNKDMTITYVLSFEPPSQLKLLLDEFDLWPRPNGVGFGYLAEAAITFGLYPIRAQYDNYGVTGTIGNGVLRVALQDYVSYDVDTYGVTGTIGDGTLISNGVPIDYVSYDVDTYAVTGTIGTGTLAVTLIDYVSYDADTYAVTGTIGTGTLV